MYVHTFLMPILDVPICIDGRDERSTLFFSVSIPNMRKERRVTVTESAIKMQAFCNRYTLHAILGQ